MKNYYYGKQDLFGTTWVECTRSEFFDAQVRLIPVKHTSDLEPVEHDPLGEQPRDKELLESIEYEIHTPMKDAILDELRDKVPAAVSEIFDILVDEEDFKVTPEQVEYFIDEELINPDYDDFDDNDEIDFDNNVVTPPIANSSTSTNRWFPRAPITLPSGKAAASDIIRIQRAIYTLMEGGMVHDSDQLDGDKFVARLETHRDVTVNTRQKDRANPSILFLPDFSPSCVSYATLYNTLLGGVSSIRDDFNVVSAPHFNGLPKWFVVNGKRDNRAMEVYGNDYTKEDSDGEMWGNVSEHDDAQKFYAGVLAKRCALYSISTVIVAGDMDGTWCYKLLLANAQIERIIWVDGSYWKQDIAMKERTSELLYKLNFVGSSRKVAKSKLIYWSGVKTVNDFVRAIERSNSW